MIRKCVASMMAMVLVLSLLIVMPARAEDETELWVNNIDLLADADKSIACGNGTVSYDDTTKTLTLNNAQITEAYEIEDEYYGEVYQYGIYLKGFAEPFKILLEGKNTINYSVYGDESNGIFAIADLNITGTGSLDIAGTENMCGIYSNNNITLESTTITMNGDDYSEAMMIYAKNDLVVDSSVIKANKVYRAIQSTTLNIKNKSDFNIIAFSSCITVSKTAVVDDSKIVAETNWEENNAFYASSGLSINNNSDVTVTSYYPALFGVPITIDNSKVNAKSHSDAAIYTTSKLEIKNNSDVVASGKSAGVVSKSSMIIEKSSVTATGNKAMYSNSDIEIDESVVNAEGSEYAVYVQKTSSQKSLTKKPTTKDTKLIQLTGASYDVEGSVLNETEWQVVEFYDSELEENVKKWRAISYLATSTGLAAKKISVKVKDADYTKLDELLAQIEALNKDDYINYYEIENAMTKIVRGLNANHQNEVDDMAWALQIALDILEKKPEPEVPIVEEQVKKVKFTKKKINLKVGKKATLKVKLTPSELSKAAKKVKWSIDKKGKKVVKFVKKANKLTGKLSAKIKAVKKGKAKITCKAPNGKKAVCKIVVK